MNNRTNWILAAIALMLAGAALVRGGPELVLDGLIQGIVTLISVIPLLIAAFLIAGLAQVLIRPEMVNRWLGGASGWRGILVAYIGGTLLPGGPYVYYPIAAVLMKAGASLGVLVSFVTAKNILSLDRLPLELAFLGPRLTLIRMGLTVMMPPVLGWLAERLFGHRIGRIGEAADL